MAVTVTNMRTGETAIYVGIPPERAAICAHAQLDHQDWNTWTYHEKYKAERGTWFFFCGDWAAPFAARET